MFSSLVPVQVHNALASYEARKADVINMETGRLREHTQLMNGILASLNLPAALDDATSKETLPESIRAKSAKVKTSGGIDELQRLFRELPSLYKRNEEILDETNRLLKEEKESDDNLRRQFGNRWNRMTSEQLTGPLLQEVGKYRGILNTASNADKTVHQKFEANQEGISLLSKNEADLRSSIPGQQSSGGAGGNSEAIHKLRSLMDEVQEIKVEREKLEKELKEAGAKSDISRDFLAAMADSAILNEEHISKEKIEQIYGPLREAVATSVKRQDGILEQVQTWNNRFVSERSGGASGAERERVLKLLASGHDAFLELKANLEEGTKFYNDLTPILVRIQQKVSDFCFARQTEKEDLMRQLQQNILSGTSGSTAAAPPRPPPPRPAAPPASNASSVEPPIAPPRSASNLQAPSPTSTSTASAPAPAAAPQQQYPQQHQQQQPQGYAPYPYTPYGQPQPPPNYYQQPAYQPQFQSNFAQPYPTFPGAFPAYQQQPYGGYPPQPQNPYAQNFPPQQPPTNPFAPGYSQQQQQQ